MKTWRAATLLAVGAVIGMAMVATPAGAHVGGTVNHLWGHLKPKADARYANVVAGTDRANNADKLDGLDSGAFGTAVYTNSAFADEEFCTAANTWAECAPITIVVPAGKTFLAHANAAGMVSEFGQADTLYLNCISARLEPSTDANCGGLEHGGALPNGAQENIAATRILTLTEGTWVISHGIWSNNALDYNVALDRGLTVLTISLTNAATGSPVAARLVKVNKTSAERSR